MRDRHSRIDSVCGCRWIYTLYYQGMYYAVADASFNGIGSGVRPTHLLGLFGAGNACNQSVDHSFCQFPTVSGLYAGNLPVFREDPLVDDETFGEKR